MFKNNLLARSIRFSLLVTSSAILLPSGFVSAQTSDEQTKSVEKIQITGSRIKRTDLESASPVSIISAQDITLGGFTSVEQVLQQSTASSGTGDK